MSIRTKFQTDDGELFDSYEAAAEHEELCPLLEEVEKVLYGADPHEPSPYTLALWIMKNFTRKVSQ